MRFLCLHGRGTCAQALEMQSSSLRNHLEDHEFVFVNGTVPTKPVDADHSSRIMDEHYGYIMDGPDADQCRELLSTMIEFVHDNGPFDGVFGFSEGGMIAALLLVEDARRPFAGFRCGILFSAAPPFDPDISQSTDNNIRALGMNPIEDGVIIKVPTAHIRESSPPSWLWRFSPLAPLWAKHDMGNPTRLNEAMIGLCDGGVREVFTHHDVGHDIPGTRSKMELAGALRAIERTIERCQDR
uniref:Serine hydrolase domain-containing protein n=1 Tax=Bionectria ochroleuca TaxID=29856 RepID=A0A8H7N6W5_BIOOC